MNVKAFADRAAKIGAYAALLDQGKANENTLKKEREKAVKGLYQEGFAQYFRIDVLRQSQQSQTSLRALFLDLRDRGLNTEVQSVAHITPDAHTVDNLVTDEAEVRMVLFPEHREAVSAYGRQTVGGIIAALKLTSSWKSGNDREIAMRILEAGSCLRAGQMQSIFEYYPNTVNTLGGDIMYENRTIASSVMFGVLLGVLRERPTLYKALELLLTRHIQTEYMPIANQHRMLFQEFVNNDRFIMLDALDAVISHGNIVRYMTENGAASHDTTTRAPILDRARFAYLHSDDTTVSGIDITRRHGKGYDRVVLVKGNLPITRGAVAGFCQDSIDGHTCISPATYYPCARESDEPPHIRDYQKRYIESMRQRAMECLAQHPHLFSQIPHLPKILLHSENGVMTYYCAPESAEVVAGVLKGAVRTEPSTLIEEIDKDLTIAFREETKPQRTNISLTTTPEAPTSMSREEFRRQMREAVGDRLQYGSFERLLKRLGCRYEHAAGSHKKWYNPDPAIDKFLTMTRRYDGQVTTDLDTGQVSEWLEEMCLTPAQQELVLAIAKDL